MSDEKPSPVMSETLIERSVSLANRAITMGYPVPIALAALETALIAAWRECDARVMLELLRKHEWTAPTVYGSSSCCGECNADGSPSFPVKHDPTCTLGALLDKHGRTP